MSRHLDPVQFADKIYVKVKTRAVILKNSRIWGFEVFLGNFPKLRRQKKRLSTSQPIESVNFFSDLTQFELQENLTEDWSDSDLGMINATIEFYSESVQDI